MFCFVIVLFSASKYIFISCSKLFFQSEADDVVNDAADEGSDIPVSPKPGSRTRSPFNMSSGVMTKRGPIVEQVGIT